MKKLILLVLLATIGCSKAVSVDNEVKGSEAKLYLVAETPEGVKIYYLDRTGDYPVKIAVTKDGKSVAITQH